MKIQQIHFRLLQYIVLSMLIIVSLSKDLNAQSIEYKNFIKHPPTVDPTYGKPIPAVKHRSGPIADWIWSNSTSNEQKVYFRKTFMIHNLPKSAVIYITGDDGYFLWINGRPLEKELTPEDNLTWKNVQHCNITKYLLKGKNIIAVEGINKKGTAGILAMLNFNGKLLLTTDKTWKVFNEITPPMLWNQINFNDELWRTAKVITPYGSGYWGSDVAAWPGAGGDEEYFAHMPIMPKKVYVKSGEGHITGAESLTNFKGGKVLITPTSSPSDTQHVLMFDFGNELAGRLQIWGTRGRKVIITTGESVQECTHEELALDNHGPFTLILEGKQPSSTPYTAFRYARIQYNGSKPLRLTKVLCDFKYYPVSYKGSFNCSDSLLTQIWYAGAYTAHLCMQEDIWDAPKRDRGLWIGDMQVSGQTINVAFGDKFLMEHSIERVRDLAQGDRPDSALPLSEVNSIPGYSAAWFCTLADYYLHQGDKNFLKRQHQKIISLLKYLQTDFDNKYLFNNPHKVWDFCDWAPGFVLDGPFALATTDLFIIYGVKEAVFLLDQLGDKVNADHFKKWNSQLIQAARHNLFNDTSKTYSKRLQENVMAVLSGVAKPEQDSIIFKHVINPESPAWIVPKGKSLRDNEVMSPYYGYFVINAMNKLEHDNTALNLIRRYWGNMLSRGTTTWWEMFDPSWPRDFNWVINRLPYLSLSHGWSSGPTSFLTEHILGVQPVASGYDDVIIKPNLCDLKWAEGSVPTPHGIILVTAFYRNNRLTVKVKLPSGIRANILVPGISRRVYAQGEYIITSK